jgi:hypothetical protein
MYRAAGIRLEKEPRVGVGSVASRQSDTMLSPLFGNLQQKGLKLHAFGLSSVGLQQVHPYIDSADSMVWSYIARRRKLKHPTCKSDHSICNNCLTFARSWRGQIVRQFS